MDIEAAKVLVPAPSSVDQVSDCRQRNGNRIVPQAGRSEYLLHRDPDWAHGRSWLLGTGIFGRLMHIAAQ